MRQGYRSPCLGCGLRARGCHGSCPAYQQFAAKNKALREKIHREAEQLAAVRNSFKPRKKD